MNRNVLMIVGGCAALLLICCVVIGVVYVVYGNTFQQQILQSLGVNADLPIATVVPTLPPVVSGGKITPGVVPTVGASSSKSSSSVGAISGNPFAEALGKAKNASKYRIQFSMVLGATTNNKYTEDTLFSMTGEVDGKNTHFSSAGGFLAMLSGDANGTIEFMTADGKTYMKGVKILTLTDPKVWYVTSDNSTSSGMESFAKPDAFQDYAKNPNDFKKVGSESLDGQQCDIWAGTVTGFDTSMFGAFGAGKDTGDLGVVDKSETRVSLCADGYVHKFVVDYEGHNAKTPTEKGAFKLSGHMWDFNSAAIKVTPPTDAKPMPGGR